MKSGRSLKGLLLGAALLLTSTAFAANKTSLKLNHPVVVGATTLPAGDYAVTWDGNGPNVEVKVLKGRDVVATVPAEVKETPRTTALDQVVTRTNADGSSTLTDILMRGKKYSLAIGEGGAETASTSSK